MLDTNAIVELLNKNGGTWAVTGDTIKNVESYETGTHYEDDYIDPETGCQMEIVIEMSIEVSADTIGNISVATYEDGESVSATQLPESMNTESLADAIKAIWETYLLTSKSRFN